MRSLVLLLLAVPAMAADVTSTRVTTYDFQAQDAQGNRISDHTRFDTALIACLNNPQCVYVAGGKYKITRTAVATNPPATGTADLTWTAPTKNTDGSALTDLAGYKVYHGTSQTQLTDIKSVTGTAYTFTGLASGTHYFSVTALNKSGVESAISVVASKVIP